MILSATNISNETKIELRENCVRKDNNNIMYLQNHGIENYKWDIEKASIYLCEDIED